MKPSPNPEGSNYQLTGVATNSSSDAWAVGSYLAGTAQQTLLEHWNGKAWKVEKTPSPGGNDNPPLRRGGDLPIQCLGGRLHLIAVAP